jgi:NAD(P)-dependent dehydrogenase (short-subunit alcohol dehydrogenase family)
MTGFLIFGATGGIGSELCRQLAGHGHRVAVAGRSEQKVRALATELDGVPLVVDATDVEAVNAAADQAREALGGLAGMANLVGSILLKPAHLTKESEWQDTIHTNLGSAFAVVRAAGRLMRTSGGAVVLVSTAAAQIGLPNHEAIAAAKAGVVGLTRSAAATYAPAGIRFNAVAPGLVRTPLTERIWKNEAAARGSVAMHGLGRLGEPRDVAAAIRWLLNPEQSWVTGQVLGVEGGLASVKLR